MLEHTNVIDLISHGEQATLTNLGHARRKASFAPLLNILRLESSSTRTSVSSRSPDIMNCTYEWQKSQRYLLNPITINKYSIYPYAYPFIILLSFLWGWSQFYITISSIMRRIIL